MKVIKRDCSYADFDKDKIKNAILKAMKNGSGITKEKIAEDIANEIYEENKELDEIDISAIENLVFDKLISKRQKLTAKAYEGYRTVREFQREHDNTTDNQINELLQGESDYWNTENSNKNPRLLSTQRDYLAGIISTDITRRFLLPPEVVQAHDEGIIHFHDADYYAQNAITNCALINLEDMLQNGTCINKVKIEKPHRLITAMTIATQIITAVTSSQFGGATITLTHLAPFVRESFNRYFDKYKSWGFNDQDSDAYAREDLKKEISDSVQTFNYQCNSMTTTNGQAPFLSVCMYMGETEEYKEELASLIHEFLNQRIMGMKNEAGVYVTQAFPKLLYILEEDNIREGSPYWYLTKLAAECTAKRMVPDYISEKIMLRDKIDKEGNGHAYPCMGCVDGQEIITYKFEDKLYVESFERMWLRLSDHFAIKNQYSHDNPNLYMDLENVEIYDTNKGFTVAKRINRNVSDNWIDLHLSNGRRLLCTDDHIITTIDNKSKRVDELVPGEEIMINSSQYCEESIVFPEDKAWLLGVMVCDGCYQKGIFASIALDGEDEIEDKFKKVFTKYFDLKVDTVVQNRGKKGNYKDLLVKSDDLNEKHIVINYFNKMFGGENKINRQIPNEVFSWDIRSKYAFLAGMIDADGYINNSQNQGTGSIIQIGSTNKELALQQMTLAQALGMPAKIYHNHYNKEKPHLIRYRIEFRPTEELIQFIECKKKVDNYEESFTADYNTISKVIGTTPITVQKYSYDVTTESEHFEVSGIYSHNCRSFLTPYINANGEPQYYSRFNQGVVTLSLPDIALSSNGDFDTFWEIFEERTELCHKALRCRHERLLGTVSDVAPILWQEGAFARLKKGEVIDELLCGGFSTISLGYAGLYECVKYMIGDSHTHDGKQFALQLMQALNDKCTTWKQAENIDYSLYGTPIESTTYKFAKCLKQRFGEIGGVTDKNYITNSYHIPVFEEIDPFEKLALESEFQKLSPGGAISYIETACMNDNIEAVLRVIQFIYDNIMYAELNTKSDYCQECGYDGEIKIIDENNSLVWECPNCGNRDTDKLNVARRTCGYIGTNFWNTGRTEEIKERYVHLDDHVAEEGVRD